MNTSEVGKLLGLMSLVDYRKVPDDPAERNAMIAFWLELVGDLPYADAAQAVRDHYAQSSERMMPSHVRDGVKTIRAGRLDRTPLPPAPPEIAADGRAYTEWKAEQTRRIASGDTELRALPGGGDQ